MYNICCENFLIELVLALEPAYRFGAKEDCMGGYRRELVIDKSDKNLTASFLVKCVYQSPVTEVTLCDLAASGEANWPAIFYTIQTHSPLPSYLILGEPGGWLKVS